MAARASTSALTASSCRRRYQYAEPLITAVDVAPACEHDGPQAEHLIDAQPEQRRPRRVLGDTAYGTGPSAPNSPSATSTCSPRSPRARSSRAARQARLQIDLDAGTVTCPAGQTARSAPNRGAPPRALAKAACDAAALRDRCVQPARGAKQSCSRPTKSC